MTTPNGSRSVRCTTCTGGT
ncbi:MULTISPECIES: hypothetical protein [unclassified Kitasatospora]